jgi:hypothetical protein
MQALQSGFDVVCGHVQLQDVSTLRKLESALSSIRVAAGCGQDNPPFARGANWSMKTAVLQKAGGFASISEFPSGDDVHLLKTFKRLGAAFAFLTKAGSHVRSSENFNSTVRFQQSRRRYGKLAESGTSGVGSFMRNTLSAIGLISPLCLLLLFHGYSTPERTLLVFCFITTFIFSFLNLKKGFRMIGNAELFSRSYLLILLFPYVLYYTIVGNIYGYKWKQ